MQTSRTRSRRDVRPGAAHPVGTPTSGLSPNTGPLAAAAWLAARELCPTEPRWFVELAFDTLADDSGEAATRFLLEIYSEEWGYMFRHAGQTSWIRVTDIPFVHGRDDHGLLDATPKLRDIGRLVRSLETRFRIELPRHQPLVRTSLPNAEPVIAEWAKSL